MIEITNALEAEFAVAQLSSDTRLPMLELDDVTGRKVRWFGRCIPKHVRFAVVHLTDKPEEYVQEIRTIGRGSRPRNVWRCSECGKRAPDHD